MLTYWNISVCSRERWVFERICSDRFLQRGRKGEGRPVAGVGSDGECDAYLRGCLPPTGEETNTSVLQTS